MQTHTMRHAKTTNEINPGIVNNGVGRSERVLVSNISRSQRKNLRSACIPRMIGGSRGGAAFTSPLEESLALDSVDALERDGGCCSSLLLGIDSSPACCR